MTDTDPLAARLEYLERQVAWLWSRVHPGEAFVPFIDAIDGGAIGSHVAPPGEGHSMADPGIPESVVALARAGKQAAAVMEYRRLTGAGLARANDAVNSIANDA